MARSCIIVTNLAIILVLAVFVMHGNAIERLNFRTDDTRNNWPRISDLKIYLKSLHKIVDFCTKNKNDLDMNFAFGLFLMSVNLKSVLKLRQSQLYDEPDLLNNFDFLLKKNDKLLDFFQRMANEHLVSGEVSRDKAIASLFSDEKQWIRNVQTFDRSVVVDTNYHKLNENMQWNRYLRLVDLFDMHVPSPELSDKCLASLAENPVYHDPEAKCEVDDVCYDMVLNGTDFGYALTHRLIFILQAKYGRNCSIFSPARDRALHTDLCTKVYEEVKLIFENSRSGIDLMCEQMVVCVMVGHAQFLQRHWLAYIFRRQTSLGCFGMVEVDSKEPIMTVVTERHKPWKLNKGLSHSLKDGQCNGHMTSVAAGALSAAIRFILETQI